MHWHGQHHVKTPYMDGVPYVSQCPILPGSTFRYDFIATEAGTHFWHSHSGIKEGNFSIIIQQSNDATRMIFNRVRNPFLGFQRGDGVFGPLIVRTPPKVNWHNDLYDIDKYIIQISDWTHELGIDKFLNHHHAGGDNKPPNILINGLGRFTVNRIENNISAIMPTAIFTVKQVILNKQMKKIYIYKIKIFI